MTKNKKSTSEKIWSFLNLVLSIEFALFLFIVSVSIFIGGEIYGIVFLSWIAEKLPNLSLYCFMAFTIIAFIYFLRIIFDMVFMGEIQK